MWQAIRIVMAVIRDDRHQIAVVRIRLHDKTEAPDSRPPCAYREYLHALQVQADASAGDTDVSRHRRLRSDE
jgi:hypothetical protein